MSARWQDSPPLLLVFAPGVAVVAVLGVAVALLLPGVLTPVSSSAAAVASASPAATTPPGAAAPPPPATPREPATGARAADSSGSAPRIVDRPACGPEFVACVDLRTQQAWLQRGPAVLNGPVPLMPGTETALRAPGPDSSATPTGEFTVEWKNATQVSSEYGDPMTNAVFFAPGGIAFHEGSLAASSHGCVHLGPEDAAAFFAELQVGDRVLVF